MDEDEFERVIPPWKVFSEISPSDVSAHTRQGRAEPYFDEIWRPFWTSLSPTQRTAYLDHWHATPAWRDAMSIFDRDSDLDLEADACESEAYLAELRRRRATEARPPFWTRLLGRK
jgi:hypothetical protein